MSKHTATPWDYIGSKRTKLFHIETAAENKAGAGIPICSVATGEANAAHIVRCVNLFPELVEALEATHTVLQTTAELPDGRLADYVETRHGSLLRVVSVIHTARVALAKAKEGA